MKARASLACCAAALLAAGVAIGAAGLSQGPPEERYFGSNGLQFAKAEYAVRRSRLIDALQASGGGVFLTPSRHGLSEGFTFHQLDDFLYFTGLELPDSILAVDAELRRVTLFVPARDPRFESRGRRNDFPGRPLQTDPELGWRSGIDHIVDAGAFEAQLADWARRRRTLRVDAGFRGQLAVPALTPIQTWSPEQHMIAAIARMAPGVKLISASADVARLRMVKSRAEIAAMRAAASLTVRAVEETAAHIGPGVDERSLEGDLEAAFKRGGGQRLPFASIIKSGPNALWPWRILAADSDRRNRRMQAGEIVIFDVGVELNHYTSDVGRTFPVSGRFSDEQRRLLEMETRVADAIINAMRPGTTLAALQRVADAAIPEGERPYMQTPLYFGHHIGLSSGDPSLPGALLEPGMIITVEPWYYNHDRGISVFTEDDLLITGDGAENLTAALPRTPEALEHLVRR